MNKESSGPHAFISTDSAYGKRLPKSGFEEFIEEMTCFPPLLPCAWREVVAVFLSVAAFDFFIYQGVVDVCLFSGSDWLFGATGIAGFCFAIPFIFWLGARHASFTVGRLAATVFLWCAGLRIVYSGVAPLDTFIEGRAPISGELAVVCAVLALILLGLVGLRVPFELVQWIRYGASSVFCLAARPWNYCETLFTRQLASTRRGIAAILVPLAAVLIFSLIFVQAQPILQLLRDQIWSILVNWSVWFPSFARILIWILTFCFFSGLLAWRNFDCINAQIVNSDEADTTEDRRDITIEGKNNPPGEQSPAASDPSVPSAPSVASDLPGSPNSFDLPGSGAFLVARNTLAALAVLFAGNLILEYASNFQNNWPAGFDFGTYCHQGAAWLTFALFLVTIVLCVIFSPAVYRNPRVGQLKFWAFLWTLENFLLVIAIYHRLAIYIGQTGLTSLRVVGLFGVTAVAGGLFWISVRALKHRNWDWLILRYAITVGTLVVLFCLLPIDAIVYKYNTKLMCSGNLAPAIHLTDQSISTEGWLQVFPLLHCENETVRQAAAVLLNKERTRIQEKLNRRAERIQAVKDKGEKAYRLRSADSSQKCGSPKSEKRLSEDCGSQPSLRESLSSDWRGYCYAESEFLKQAKAYDSALKQPQYSKLEEYRKMALKRYR